MEVSASVRDNFIHIVNDIFPNLTTEDPLYNVIALSSILVVSAVIYIIARLLVRPQIASWVYKSNNLWDNALQQHGFFRRLMHLFPALFIYLTTPVLISDEAVMHGMVIKSAQLYMLYSGLLALYAMLSTVEDVYNASALAKRAPITGFIQVTKLAFAIVTILLSISLIVDRSPLLIVSGLTAIAAVLLLIFRDTILGFVAGIQIAANRMFNTGDWIAMPKYEVDGEILEIGLTNVKVQNWDKTISTLPTYSLTTEAVIFFISGFEKPPVEYDWSVVYPELQGSDEERPVRELDQMLVKAKVDSELIQSLGEGLRKVNQAANGIGSVADIADSTNEYSSQVSSAAKNLESINALYEAQIQSSTDQTEAARLMAQNMVSSANDAQQMQQELAALSKNLNALNGVYGNMLSAMNINK